MSLSSSISKFVVLRDTFLAIITHSGYYEYYYDCVPACIVCPEVSLEESIEINGKHPKFYSEVPDIIEGSIKILNEKVKIVVYEPTCRRIYVHFTDGEYAHRLIFNADMIKDFLEWAKQVR